jgi:hypothetical protein
MPPRKDHENLQLGDTILVATAVDEVPLGLPHRLVAFDRPTELTLVDRRTQMRVAMRKSIGVRLARTSAAGGGGHFSIGTTIDVGATGIRFETAAQMAIGDHVFVSLVLEGNRQFYAMAQIVRMDDTRSPLDIDPQLPGSRSQEGKRHIRAAAMWDAMAPTDRARLESFLLKATTPSPS